MQTTQVISRLAALTRREQEILQRMAVGRSNHGICEDLGLAMKTVESHTGAIYTKLGLDAAPGANRRVLAVLAYLTERSTQTTATGVRFEPPRRSCD